MSAEPKNQPGLRRNRAEALQIVAAFEASGLRASAFCAQHGLKRSTFNRYRRWQREEQSAHLPRWLPVEVSTSKPEPPGSPESQLSVWLAHGRRIEVPRGFDALTLRQLIDLLESA